MGLERPDDNEADRPAKHQHPGQRLFGAVTQLAVRQQRRQVAQLINHQDVQRMGR